MKGRGRGGDGNKRMGWEGRRKGPHATILPRATSDLNMALHVQCMLSDDLLPSIKKKLM